MNILDVDGLNDVFDVEGELVTLDSYNTDLMKQESALSSELDVEERSNFVDDELKSLLQTANQLLNTAKYLLDASPDAESIVSASSLINSIGGIIREFNKTVMLNKQYELKSKLEEMKIDARRDLEEMRAHNRRQQLSIGSGSTVNIQNNNLTQFTQEDIVRQIIRSESKPQK